MTMELYDDATALESVARRLAERLRIARRRIRRMEKRHEALMRANARLSALASTDDLTGLKNRRHFRESLERSFALAARRPAPFSVVLADLDDFKTYNDVFGHPAGDDVLRSVAAILRDGARTHDEVARFGGEEFVLLLPGTDADAARYLAERLRREIERDRRPLRPVTASFGIATATSETADALQLVAEADRALYHSKGRGRNRVTHHHDLAGVAEAHPTPAAG